MRSISQNLKLLNFSEGCPVCRAVLSLSIRTIGGNQDVRNAAAWLELVTNRQLMQSNLQRLSISKFDAHSLAYVRLI